MKLSFSSSFALVFACTMAIVLTSCKVQEEPIMPEVSFDACGSIGTVMEHKCGLYIAVEKGPNIYANSTKGLTLSPGMKVRLGYFRSTTVSNTNTSHSGGTCGEGNNSNTQQSSNSPVLSAEAICMMENDISLAVITCIEKDDDLN